MRPFALAVLAAVIGSGLTLVCVESEPPIPTAEAQVQSPPRVRLREGVRPDLPTAQSPQAVAEPAAISPAERTNASVYTRCNRGVVNISVTTIRRSFFGAIPESGDSGSGVVIDREGHVLTNFHVVEGARRIVVTLHDGREYVGNVVGFDSLNDIALLKIDAKPESLSPIELGESSTLFVGQNVYAIGNPFGLERTLSTGIIASLGRSLQVREDWVIKSVIQIDAAINPGNSGGPLLDSRGRLIGINTAIAARAQQSAGIGFAIPADLIRRSLSELKEYGRIVRGDLGITAVTELDSGGLRVMQLDPRGAAKQAGIRGPLVEERREGNFITRRVDTSAADVIVALDGQQVTQAAELFARLDGRKPGEQVELTVIRNGELTNVEVTLGEDGR